MLFQLAFVALLVAVNGNHVCIESCNGRDDGDYQKCGVCNFYITCTNGFMYDMPCPANLVWEDSAKECLEYSNSCWPEHPYISDPCHPSFCDLKSVGHLYPACGTCAGYVTCANGVKSFQACPSGTFFSSKNQACGFSQDSECTEDSTGSDDPCDENFCVGKQGVYSRHCTSCSKFIQCDNGKKVEKECQSGLLWNRDINACDFSYNVNCETK